MSATGSNPAEAYDYIEKQLIEIQNIMHVDGVSGATYSLFRFRCAIIIALIKAKIGNN